MMGGYDIELFHRESDKALAAWKQRHAELGRDPGVIDERIFRYAFVRGCQCALGNVLLPPEAVDEA